MKCRSEAVLSSLVQLSPSYKRGTSLCREINSFCLPGSGVCLPGSAVGLLGSGVCLPGLGVCASNQWLTAQMQVVNTNKQQNRLFISQWVTVCPWWVLCKISSLGFQIVFGGNFEKHPRVNSKG